MQKLTTLYFDWPGPENTDAVVAAVKERATQLKITHVVTASNKGGTALKLYEALKDTGITIASVGEHYGYTGGDKQLMPPEVKTDLEAKGVKLLFATHALSGVARSVSKKLGGVNYPELIAHVLRRVSEGTKVAVEVAVMAADAGLVPTDREIIALGGTGQGADTALVLQAAHMNNFFDLEIREIIAKPRQRKTK